jgi:hypothetical protein
MAPTYGHSLGKVDEHGPSFLTVSVSGKADGMPRVFEAICSHMAGGGGPEEESEGAASAPALFEKLKAANLQLTTWGIRAMTGSTRYFLPWKHATNFEFTKPAVGKGALVFTSRVGNRIPIRGLQLEDYDRLREIYLHSTKVVSAPQQQSWVHSAIVRKGIRIAYDGVTIPTRSGLKQVYKFHPWTVVDGIELDIKFGVGEIVLVTEDGDRLVAAKSFFQGYAPLLEALVKLRGMKYGDTSDPDSPDNRWFAGARGNPKACVLTNVSIRLVASTSFRRVVCILDLDSVDDVAVTNTKPKCGQGGSQSHLVLYISKAMADAFSIDEEIGNANMDLGSIKPPRADQSLIVMKLKKADKPMDIKNDILKRAKKRKADELTNSSKVKKSLDVKSTGNSNAKAKEAPKKK